MNTNKIFLNWCKTRFSIFFWTKKSQNSRSLLIKRENIFFLEIHAYLIHVFETKNVTELEKKVSFALN
ncbi:hypothetical protein BpHYR1_046613 [Brachionus plicatilis]|uniref:Uncharacterized protein n=1 Tax=Brachionus plicatilis TaxID=10195 RepID=A0A3M7RAC8_BRAPC|nr:hypothetical protein BpHYR1_046613 [Brachionus plicatilis]